MAPPQRSLEFTPRASANALGEWHIANDHNGPFADGGETGKRTMYGGLSQAVTRANRLL